MIALRLVAAVVVAVVVVILVVGHFSMTMLMTLTIYGVFYDR